MLNIRWSIRDTCLEYEVIININNLSCMWIIVYWYIILDTFATFYGLRAVDYFMQSVSATDISIIVVSLILALFGISDIDRRTKGID